MLLESPVQGGKPTEARLKKNLTSNPTHPVLDNILNLFKPLSIFKMEITFKDKVSEVPVLCVISITA